MPGGIAVGGCSAARAGYDFVAEPADRDDLRGYAASLTQLDPQAAYMHVDRPTVAGLWVAPHQLRQRIAQDHLVRSGREDREQAVFRGRELKHRFGDGNLM